MSAPALWIVATPIGNLDDITLRALKVLGEVDLILAEDTRRTATLLRHHGIGTSSRAFHAHSAAGEVDRLVERMVAGERFALVSDAGTPVISDPGVRLVAAAREAGLEVSMAPGPSAVLGALSIAGLRADRFVFLGFLPRSAGKRRAAVEAMGRRSEASVLFESPQRVGGLLEVMAELFPERRVAVCRELTKRFEEVARGLPGALAERFADGARGEITVVVEAAAEEAPELDAEDREDFVRAALAEGQRVRQIAKALAKKSELSASEAYEVVLSVQRDAK
ncbi:MAG: 16S rRNA (cytidine(1402)-2'-O)-methyltransferase [Sandaracinus sp.]|nr:16S rRNA (cytidine(1402)-2'-O)-methyltransferase [Sandaracinus sp.]